MEQQQREREREREREETIGESSFQNPVIGQVQHRGRVVPTPTTTHMVPTPSVSSSFPNIFDKPKSMSFISARGESLTNRMFSYYERKRERDQDEGTSNRILSLQTEKRNKTQRTMTT